MSDPREIAEVPPTSPSPTLTVTYSNTLRDLFIVAARVLGRVMMLIYLVLMGIDIIIRVLSSDPRPVEARVIEVVVFAFLLAVAFIIIALLGALACVQHLRRFANVASTVTLLDHGVRDESAAMLHEFRWPSIGVVRWVGDTILIRTTTHMLIAIHSRAFPSEGEARAFFNELHRRWTQGRREADESK